MVMISNIEQDIEKKSKALESVLSLFQYHLEGLKDEVDKSYALIKIGEYTDFTKKLHNDLANPLSSLKRISFEIDHQILTILDRVVINYIKDKAQIINSAYKLKSENSELNYFISLKEDSTVTRGLLFQFFSDYEQSEMADRYQIYFHFFEPDLESTIQENSEKIL